VNLLFGLHGQPEKTANNKIGREFPAIVLSRQREAVSISSQAAPFSLPFVFFHRFAAIA
jgi:hypothetical protein